MTEWGQAVKETRHKMSPCLGKQSKNNEFNLI